jgi:hypothetical protein
MLNLKEILDALDRLLKMFMFERYVYLALSIVSFGILLIFAFQLLTDKDATGAMLATVFGGSGLVAVASARITWFFNRAFTLIEKAVHGAQQ